MSATPRRVRVTSPRTSAARTRRVAPAWEIDSRTRLGEVYLSSLLRAQLRLALGVLTVVVGSVVALPVLFHLLPQLNDVRLLAMPLPWLLLAFGVYPFLLAAAWYYVRRAEDNERLFAAMVSGKDGSGGFETLTPFAPQPPGRPAPQPPERPAPHPPEAVQPEDEPRP